jgi:hypothetical protein
MGVLLGLVLLLALHVLPGYGGASSLSIAVYFVQMSALFLSSESLAFVMGLANLSVVGDGQGEGAAQVGVCVVPLQDAGKVWARLTMPLLCVAALALLLAVNALARYLVVRGVGGGATRLLYRLMMPRCQHTTGDAGEEGRDTSTAELQQQPPQHSPAGHTQDDLKDAAARWTEPLLSSSDASHAAMATSTLDAATSATGCEVTSVVSPPYPVQSLVSLLESYGRTFVRLLLFSYNGLAAVSLALLHLRRVGDSGGSRVWRYPTIDTQSTDYTHLLPAIVFTLMLVSISPLALAAGLAYKHRRRAADGTSSPIQPESPLQVLTQSYRPELYFYTAVILARRLVLIVVLTFVSNATYVWLTMVNMAALLLHNSAWPYRDEVDNWMEAITLTALTLQTTVLAAYPEVRQRPAGATGVLWTLFAVPCALLVVRPLWQVVAKWREGARSGGRSSASLRPLSPIPQPSSEPSSLSSGLTDGECETEAQPKVWEQGNGRGSS